MLKQKREEIFTFITLGMGNKSISNLIGISYKTLFNHRYNALLKVGIRNNAQFATWLRTPEARYSITGVKVEKWNERNTEKDNNDVSC